MTDAMTLRSGADLDELVPSGGGELLRPVRVVSGRVEVDVRLAPLDLVSSPADGRRSNHPGQTVSSPGSHSC